MKKKAQAEIMGLSIVIVLIVIGVVFALKFMNSGSDNNLRQDFVDSKLASNMINVILKTTIDCKNIEIKDLYQDCAKEVSNVYYCTGTDPCEEAEKVVDVILDKTLDKWERDYRFLVTIDGEVKTNINNSDCAPEYIGTLYKRMESETYPIPASGTTMLIRLDICR